MAKRDVPYAVARWFANGEGWSYDQHFTKPEDLMGLIEKLDDVIKASLVDRGGEIRFERPGLGGWLVGVRLPDHNVQDQKAVNRRPSILRVALLPGQEKPSAELQREVLNQLVEVLPAQRGEGNLKLRVTLPDPTMLAPAAGYNGVRDLSRCWTQLSVMWEDIVHSREYSESFLSDVFTVETTSGRTGDRETIVQRRWEPDGYVPRQKSRDVTLVQSENRLLMVGPGVGKTDCVVQVYEVKDNVIKLLTHRHIDLGSVGTASRGSSSGSYFIRMLTGEPKQKESTSLSIAVVQELVTATWAQFGGIRQSGCAVLAVDCPQRRITQSDHWLLLLAFMVPFRTRAVR